MAQWQHWPDWVGFFNHFGVKFPPSLLLSPLIQMLQESFDGLSSLKELHLDHNRVEEIQPGAFMQLGFLNMLALTHNQLIYIPNMAFQVLRF